MRAPAREIRNAFASGSSVATCVPLPVVKTKATCGPIDDEARGALLHSGYEEIGAAEWGGRSVEHGKDGAGRDIRIEIRGSVERVNRHEQRSVEVERRRLVAAPGEDCAHA